MSKIEVNIPAKIELKVFVTDEKGYSGEVTIELPAMKIPTINEIIDAIKDVQNSDVVKNSGMRVCNQKETFDYICTERAGGLFAMPRDC